MIDSQRDAIVPRPVSCLLAIKSAEEIEGEAFVYVTTNSVPNPAAQIDLVPIIGKRVVEVLARSAWNHQTTE